MEEDKKSVIKLAKETHLSPSIIQDLRSGKQQDMRVSNFISLSHALGYEIILKKGKEQLTLYETVKGLNKHIGFSAAA